MDKTLKETAFWKQRRMTIYFQPLWFRLLTQIKLNCYISNLCKTLIPNRLSNLIRRFPVNSNQVYSNNRKKEHPNNDTSFLWEKTKIEDVYKTMNGTKTFGKSMKTKSILISIIRTRKSKLMLKATLSTSTIILKMRF